MTHRVRIALFSLGFFILCIAVFALAYALWPFQAAAIQTTLSPTLFVPP